MEIKIREYKLEKNAGDRAIQTSPCSRFDVCLILSPDEIVLREFDQYDNFHCSIGNRQQTIAKAQAYATMVGNFMTVAVGPIVKMVKKTIEVVSWEEE